MPDLPSFLADPVARAFSGTLLAALIALAAWRARSLSVSGAIATTLVGGAIVAGARWWVGVVLIVYFVTASSLSSLRARSGPRIEQARGKQRDAWQVLANGGVPALLAICAPFVSQPGIVAIGCLGAIAAAAADTWATEIGKLSPTAPRLITTGRTVPAGTSGAVSLVGTAGAVAGAILIAIIAAFGWSLDTPTGTIGIAAGFGIVLLAGICGALADSLLGATVQERRWCAHCQLPTEQRLHRCGTPTDHLGGWTWMTNDLVNATSIALAGMVAMALAAIQAT